MCVRLCDGQNRSGRINDLIKIGIEMEISGNGNYKQITRIPGISAVGEDHWGV